MVGPAGLMALWMIAATPASAMFDVDGRNDGVKRAILRNEVFVRGEQAGGVWNAPLPPPRMLPYDPAYESAGPVSPPSSEGIPGLPPVEETPKPPPPPKAETAAPGPDPAHPVRSSPHRANARRLRSAGFGCGRRSLLTVAYVPRRTVHGPWPRSGISPGIHAGVA